MRLHRITLRNFRGVVEHDVELAEAGVTIIEGDNETGKSSLAEGVDLILEFPDSSKHRRIKAVMPSGADVGPEVAIAMSVGDCRFSYAKRWLRQPQTTLTITEPAPEQLTGTAAHERVREILDTHADLALWRALRLEQGVDLAQAGLDESRSLMRALDAASGSSSADDDADDLVRRVDDEFERYLTSTGRPNKELRERRETADAARRHVVEIEHAIEDLDSDIARHERLTRQLAAYSPRHEEQERRIAELELAQDEIAALESGAAQLGEKVKVAGLELEQARGDVAARSQLAKLASERELECEALARELDGAKRELQEKDAERGALRQALDTTRTELAAAEEMLAVAEADLAYHNDSLWRDTMRTRHEAVLAAQEQRTDADEFLEACRIDTDLLGRIEDAERALVEARAVLGANETGVRLESLVDQTVEIGGSEHRLAPGDVIEKPVSGQLEINLPGVMRLLVAAGADTRDLAAEVAAAEAERDRLLRAAGAEDVRDAREQQKRRDSMEQAREEAARTLETNLRDLTPEEMSAKLERLNEKLATYEAERQPGDDLPSDLESAEAAAAAARDAVGAARAALEAAQAALDQARAEQDASGKAAAASEALLAQKLLDRDAVSSELAASRADTADDALDAALAVAESRLRAAETELAAAQSELAARNPEATAASLAGATSALERLQDEQARDAKELHQLEGRLAAGGEDGLYDRLVGAQTTYERLEAEAAAMERRAAAAGLLHDALHRHRDEARRRYRAPLEEKIEQLGRIVFGDDLDVELGADLRIARRTLDGVTVPFSSLSTGAREQLCAIERLAGAALVSADGGAPVIFDDALGYSDPERLRRLGAVISLAGRDGQVLLLTCNPDRYSHVGDARLVRLVRQDPPPEVL
ncbi:MAG: AAA family ATPase [Anaerolineae bacterium]